MIYRAYEPEDIIKLAEYCKNAGIDLPAKSSWVYLAVDENENICGIIEFANSLAITTLTSEPTITISGVIYFSDSLSITTLTSDPILTIEGGQSIEKYYRLSGEWIQMTG